MKNSRKSVICAIIVLTCWAWLTGQSAVGADFQIVTQVWATTGRTYAYYLHNNFNTNGNIMAGEMGFTFTNAGPKEYSATDGSIIHALLSSTNINSSKSALTLGGYVFYAITEGTNVGTICRMNYWDTNTLTAYVMPTNGIGSNVPCTSLCTDGTNLYTDNYYGAGYTNRNHLHRYVVSNSPSSFTLIHQWEAELGVQQGTGSCIRGFGYCNGYLYASPGAKKNGASRRIYAVNASDGTATDTGVDVPDSPTVGDKNDVYDIVRYGNLLFASGQTNLYVYNMISDTNIDESSVSQYTTNNLNQLPYIYGVSCDGRKLYLSAGDTLPNANLRAFSIKSSALVPSTNQLSYSAAYGGANPAVQFTVTNSGHISLSFSNVASYGSGASGWLTLTPLASTVDPGGQAQAVTGSAAIAGLNAGTYYATNSVLSDVATNSPQSISIALTITKGAQTITFPAIGDQVVTTTVALSATASSGRPVSFTNSADSPVAWQNATTITFTATGTVCIVASQAGDINWNPAASVTQSFNVSKLTQTITFPAIADQALTSTVRLAATASSGLPVSFAVGSGPGVVSGGSNLTFSATGVVSIVASQAGNSTWNAAPSVTNSFTVVYGLSISSGVCADYDGDRLADPAVYDEATGTWKVKLSSAGYYEITTTLNGLGGPGWASVSADYDGDGKADPAVYQETSGIWLIMPSSMGYAVVIVVSQRLGSAGYSGMPADYDGDLLADPGVYQRTSGDWKVMLSSAGYGTIESRGLLGGTGYRAVAADYDGDLKGDPAVYGESNGIWIFRLSSANYMMMIMAQALGGAGYIPMPADYDGDGLADPAVKSESSDEWIVMFSSGGYTPIHINIQF